jgi:phospholipid/cholesterol/gamma-HCH transport system ATP-binding protein
MRSSSDPAAVLACRGLAHGPLTALDFALAAGESAKLLVASSEQRDVLLRVLTGLEAPRAGTVELFGEPLYALAEPARLALLARAGVVPEHGGLISNLKAWENALLPAAYHLGRTPAAAEPAVRALLAELGYRGAEAGALMARLPGELGAYERRVVALVRALLTDPEILIYDYLFAGLERGRAARLLELTGAWHARRPGRVTLHVCPDDEFAARLPTTHRIALA